MSNNTTNSIIQRVIGALVLLALIALIAILLLQPSDKLPNTVQTNQRPNISTPDNSFRPEGAQPPIIILESTPNGRDTAIIPSVTTPGGITPGVTIPQTNTPNANTSPVPPPSIEVIDEALWQQVEQSATSNNTPPAPSTNRPIAQGQNPTSFQSPKQPANQTNNKQTTSAQKPVITPPKLELIASSQANQVAKPPVAKTNQQSIKKANVTTQGTWYVQLGAFGKVENAQKVYNQYKQLGYNVRIQKINNINRVQIGPYATKNEAEQIKTRTKSKDIEPRVIHNP
ncbi:SPOR domain-containing protein [Ignatzschineria larvae DSM 13226]|uniref:SPOR domain-containing protein n=1 Tax=Ignatzschineria larvae DSM 13226 TaxID=1111732 RepID=A0ABZ3C1H3_9GAMM|nr:SPOR domain-containing protein [Ignatzschineria larvae]